MKNVLYKSLWITALVIVIGLFSMIVSAEEGCNDSIISEVSNCLGQEITEQCTQYDLNNDNAINLADISLLATSCYEETIVEPEPIKEVKKESKRHSSTFIKKEADDSYSFRTMGHAIQYPNSQMIIKWEEKYQGSTCWAYDKESYCATFTKVDHYNIVNVIKVK